MPLTNRYRPASPFEYAVTASNLLVDTLLSAEEARTYSRSWRGFAVGAAATAYFYSEHGARLIDRSHGANTKPAENSDINVHAEHVIMSMINHAKRLGEAVYVPVLAIVGDLQPDQQSGEATKTLHPCGICRDAFEEDVTPISPETLIVTADPGFTIIEWFGMKALEKVHRSGDYSGVGRAEFVDGNGNPRRSPILTRHDPGDKGFIRLADFDTLEWDALEDEYERLVGQPVRGYVADMIADQDIIAP